MLVRPLDTWIHSIAVPNCGIFQRPRTPEVWVDDVAGAWLIGVGFAESVGSEGEASELANPTPEPSAKPKKQPKTQSPDPAPDGGQ